MVENTVEETVSADMASRKNKKVEPEIKAREYRKRVDRDFSDCSTHTTFKQEWGQIKPPTVKRAHDAIKNGEDVYLTGESKQDERKMVRASEIKDWGLSPSLVKSCDDLKKGEPGYYASKIL